MNLAVNLHKNHNYVVNIKKNKSENSINVEYPENILAETKATVCKYLIEDSKIKFFINDKNSLEMESPNYSLRPIIILDILLKNAFLNVDNSLILYYNSSGKEMAGKKRGTPTLLSPPTKSKEDLKKEKILMKIMLDLLDGEKTISEEEIEKNGVADGYKNILLLLNDGGM